MKVIYQGRQRRFIGADIGDTSVIEIWQGDNQIWPNMEGLAHRIVVELPRRGTLDWQYWVHALDATSKEATPATYMKFVEDGLDYYINHSIDGSEPYVFDSNALTVDLDGVLADQLGDYLTVYARIAARIGVTYQEGDNVSPLPFLKNTRLQVKWHKGKKEKAAGCVFNVAGADSGTVHFGGWCDTSEHKRGEKIRILPENTHKWQDAVHNNNSIPTDTSLDISVSTNGSGSFGDVTPLWPAFTRTFKLKIISVS